MPTLTITEFPGANIGTAALGPASSYTRLPPLATQNLTVTSASAKSQPLGLKTNLAQFYCDVACRIEVGVDPAGPEPVAGAASLPIPAGTPVYYGVPAGVKIAAILL
jgi:hypothetical protein